MDFCDGTSHMDASIRHTSWQDFRKHPWLIQSGYVPGLEHVHSMQVAIESAYMVFLIRKLSIGPLFVVGGELPCFPFLAFFADVPSGAASAVLLEL